MMETYCLLVYGFGLERKSKEIENLGATGCSAVHCMEFFKFFPPLDIIRIPYIQKLYM